MGDLDGRVAMVTGGGSGIGLGAARALAEAGARVVVMGRDEKKLQRAVGSLGEGAWCVSGDVGNEDDVSRAVQSIEARFGHLDVAVNAAGTGTVGGVTDQRAEDWSAVLRTNLDGVMYSMKHQSAAMVRRGKGGAIVNISSAAARMGGVVGWAAYAASKGAVDSFVMNAAKDLGPQGIRICGLRPGMTRTEMLEEIGGEARIQAGISTVSLGRAAEPEEIAEAAVFLASSRASYIHGTTIDVTGGR